MTSVNHSGIIEFMRLAERLKDVRRQGWLDRGVPLPESTAEHSWASALFAWLIASNDPNLDENRVLLLALVHDLPEALAGDATPFDRHRDDSGVIPPAHFREAPEYDALESERKHAREREALVAMVAGLPEATADCVVAAWEEYNAGETPESHFVRQIDKLETLLQAELYLQQQPQMIIESFRAGADRDVTDPSLRKLLDAIGKRAGAQTGLADKADEDRQCE